MATHSGTRHRTPYESWQEGVDLADSRWHAYDGIIRSTVDRYNAPLVRTSAGYFRLDWKLVKAMAWTETGAARPEWATRPLQIGNSGDPGLRVMLRGEEGSDLIVPPMMNLSFISASRNPRANIEAGVGYLLTKIGEHGYSQRP
ncbi:hypothetical protein WKW77_09255 [Variovorax ureilyticus]|uniref:Uncharacterized protein n=1 Tax=Variovorax ureilyticus TaxID=1836198 RepID=A0ABU8VC59_9BURK